VHHVSPEFSFAYEIQKTNPQRDSPAKIGFKAFVCSVPKPLFQPISSGIGLPPYIGFFYCESASQHP
jgi:hypothetical protein